MDFLSVCSPFARDPVDSFESWYGYSHQEKVLGISLADFIQRLADGDTRDGTGEILWSNSAVSCQGTGGRNRMLWDLGIDRRDMHDDVILRQRIDELDKEFDQARQSCQYGEFSQSVPRSWSWRGLMKAWSCWQTISVGRWSRLWLVCCLTRWPLSFILGPLYKAMF